MKQPISFPIFLAIPLVFVLVFGTIIAARATTRLCDDQIGYFAWGYTYITTGQFDPGPFIRKMNSNSFSEAEINGRKQMFNKYPIGWSLATFPGMAAGRGLAAWRGLAPEDDQTLVLMNRGAHLAAVMWGVLGLMCSYKFVAYLTSRRSAAFAVLLTWLGTSAFVYTWREVTMSHVISMSLIAIAYYAASRCISQPRPWRWTLVLGLACGMLGCTRILNPILILPAFLLLMAGSDDAAGQEGQLNKLNWVDHPYRRAIMLLLIVTLAALPPIVLQMAIWKHIYGVWYFNGYSIGGEGFQFNVGNFLRFLGSSRHGLFFWHPITLAALLGLILGARYTQSSQLGKFFSISCLVVLGITTLTYGFWWYWSLGWSWGARWAADSFLLWALGLGIVSERFRRSTSRRGFVILFLLVMVSLGLTAGMWVGMIPGDSYIKLSLPHRGSFVLP